MKEIRSKPTSELRQHATCGCNAYALWSDKLDAYFQNVYASNKLFLKHTNIFTFI